MSYFTQYNLSHCCGVDEVGDFQTSDWGRGDRQLERPGTGLFVCTFTTRQRKYFLEMCKKATLLYKSPAKKNSNSDNRVYVCVFQYKAPEKVNKLPKL